MLTHRTALLIFLLSLSGVVLPSRAADAGCGCAKPPPPPAQVRPNVAYAGSPVTLFGPGLVEGTSYTITFTSGVTHERQAVSAQVVVRRDLADGVSKPQIVVPLPALPLGPVSITAQRTGAAVQPLFIDDAQFTAAPTPIALPTGYGSWHYPDFSAAVGRDGVVYITLDLTGVTKPEIFEAQAAGYPLRFTAQDVLFKNVQGFLMQLLVQGEPDAREPLPGMFVFPASNPAADSDLLHYSRHEFATYFLRHAERQPHALDPTDGNWHVDGSRHIDHDHLILAIMGRLHDGSVPAPGATPAFDLVMKTDSLFYQGLVGKSSVTMKGSSVTDSFGSSGSDGGDVLSNGPVTVADYAAVKGDATGSSFKVWTTAKVTGSMIQATTPQTFMEVKLPAGLPNLGKLDLSGKVVTITGPGSFQVGDLLLAKQSALVIDNSRGPVTLYVTGAFSMAGSSEIRVSNADPEQFAIYMTGTQPASLAGSMRFFGVLYAPRSSVQISGNTDFYGAFVGESMTTSQQARIHYYRPLRGK